MKHSSQLRVLGAALVAVALVAPSWAMEGDEAGVRLSLDEALRIALENNLDLVAARKDPEIARFRFDIADAEFDSVLNARGSYEDASGDLEIAQVLPAPGATTGDTGDSSTGARVGWGQKVAFGATYDIAYSYQSGDSNSLRVDTSTGFLNRQASDFDGGAISFTFSMPLLKGFGREVNTLNVLLSRSDIDLSEEELRLRAHGVLKEVEGAYWDLLAVRAALDVARESLKLAQDLLDLNRKKVEVGTMAPIEITQAEAGVASREEGVIVAETAVANAEDLLRRLLAYPTADPIWGKRIVPTDRPDLARRQIALDQVMDTAMRSRPEVINARRVLDDQRLNERVARRNVRHSLDLTSDIVRSDGSGDAFVSSPPLPDSLSSSDSTGTRWSVALEYTIPIGNRAAKSNYAIATLNREKSEIAMQGVEQDVRVDVRIAVRSVESAIKRVDAARVSTILQRKTLEAEQKKFENGMSTSFEVLRIQTDLSNAQVAEIRANLDYVKALADLERAQGTLLEARGLTLDASTGTN